MKKFATLTAVLALSATSAFAGTPVVVEEEPMPVVVEENSSSLSGQGVLIGLGILAVLAIAAANDDDD
ncbi:MULTISPECIES: hypothetical protein [Halocynthiibacter]|uniref:Ferrochelatase n=1 Tax=Halocynthiibacter halioticoli TaxID=2986804 RepID=A0AAE3J1U5_9RHOB|nr:MULTISPECIES: hypothetical protein [Halocynthiibacter]MCV6825844.1 hypothetical protein [Halocynthiibacter halioticoli]MCW4058845.1 hypothetical protein [Halocynthiibacter sp. SDUM655004]MDE0588356.1 hypothetical protein [Halocynthiibacter sp. C4]